MEFLAIVGFALIVYGIAIIFQVAQYMKVRTQDMEERKQRDEELLIAVKELKQAVESLK